MFCQMFKTESSENSEVFQNQIQVYFSWKTKWEASKNIQEAKNFPNEISEM